MRKYFKLGTVMTAFCFTVSGGAVKKMQELGRCVHGGLESAQGSFTDMSEVPGLW